ncbi:hypothetical protein DXG01_016426 [Tephrocybe rancida]|nr:hypothetical protein DXG01_016426 [Tephrocybe rancida]
MKLHDLPAEILLEVFSTLNNLTLHRLGGTCRRLRGISQVALTTKHVSRLQLLADAGTLSLDGHTVQDLLQQKLPFSPDIRFTIRYNTQIFEDLEAFRTLLLQLDRVSLDLRLSPLESSGQSIVLRQRWVNLLAEVMNVAAEKPQSQLTVGRGVNWRTMGRPFHYEYTEPFMPTHLGNEHPPPYHSKTESKFPLFIGPFLRLIGGIVAKFKPRGAQITLNDTSHAQTHTLERSMRSCGISLLPTSTSLLEHFNVHSQLLMELPFFHWTMSILATCPITRLSFSDIDLTHYDWEYILATMSIPTLTHISFGSSNIAFPDLQMFLSRHSSITTLDLSRNTAIGHLKPFSSQKLLPNLNHLIANSEYLSHFLEPPKAFPALQSITMATGYVGGLRFLDSEMRQFDAVLRRIAGRTRDVELIFRFVSDAALYGLNTWLRSIHMRVGTEVKAVEQVPNVVKLEVFVNIPPAPDTLDDLLRFFPMFPSLKHLMFSGSFWNAKADADAIRLSIWQSMPGLETMDKHSRPGL